MTLVLNACPSVCARMCYILHTGVPWYFVKQTMLVFIPYFMQLTKPAKTSDHEILYLSFYYTYELSPWMSTVVIYFKGALFQNYFKLVQTEKTSSFPLRLKTRMSSYTGAIQSLFIETKVDTDILTFEVTVSQNYCHWSFGNFQVVLELSNHGHQQLFPFYYYLWLNFLPDVREYLPCFSKRLFTAVTIWLECMK